MACWHFHLQSNSFSRNMLEWTKTNFNNDIQMQQNTKAAPQQYVNFVVKRCHIFSKKLFKFRRSTHSITYKEECLHLVFKSISPGSNTVKHILKIDLHLFAQIQILQKDTIWNKDVNHVRSVYFKVPLHGIYAFVFAFNPNWICLLKCSFNTIQTTRDVKSYRM